MILLNMILKPESLNSRKEDRWSTQIIITHMSSDLERIIITMNGLGNSIHVQEREYSSPALKELTQEEFDKYDNIINRLFILDNNDVLTVGLAQEREPLIGSDLSLWDLD